MSEGQRNELFWLIARMYDGVQHAVRTNIKQAGQSDDQNPRNSRKEEIATNDRFTSR